MGRWNGYLLLVVSLTIAQLIYDISIVLIPCEGEICYRITVGLRCFSGIASTLWTNVISLIIFYVVYFLKAFDIIKWYPVFLFVVGVPSLVLGYLIPMTSGHIWNDLQLSYTIIRIISIIINIVIYLLLTSKLRQRQERNTSRSFSASKHDPVTILAFRMKYYPIVLIITRFATSFYEQIYGYDNNYNASGSVAYKITLFLYAITLPSAGIGFFLIFIWVTPGAASHLKRKWIGLWRLCFPQYFDNTMTSNLTSSSSNAIDGIVVHSKSENDASGHPEEIESRFSASLHIDVEPSENMSIDYSGYDEQHLTSEISRIYSIGTGVDNPIYAPYGFRPSSIRSAGGDL